ncbi:hypothetical protein ACQPYK_13555 [Streptosporangium sp. CA-135522]|uniref:hypothetical protein n=1 Tax=Streptosporangium sp. CA-135522 TaxID=3240072 RepID=UPI003D930E52
MEAVVEKTAARRCHEHGTRDCTITITATPMPAGTSAYEQSLKRSPVAVCRGCGHSISHIDGEWISGPVTACPGLEHGPHQPAVIRREAHLASDARPCRRSEPHDLTRC